MHAQWRKMGTPPKTVDLGVEVGAQTEEDTGFVKQRGLQRKLRSAVDVAERKLVDLRAAHSGAEMQQAR
jgi:hypothetical protein